MYAIRSYYVSGLKWPTWKRTAKSSKPRGSSLTCPTAQLDQAQFVACGEGETGLGGPLHLYIGRPGLQQDVILYNFIV